MTHHELEQIHIGREVIYSCLSRIFLDIPDTDFYEMLETFVAAVAQMKDDSDNEDLKYGAVALSDFLSYRKQLSSVETDKFDKDVSRDFTGLYFLTDSIPMSESVYTSPERLAMQRATGLTWKFYQQYAFDMSHYSNEPTDHISYELMFMSYMAKRTQLLLKNGDIEKAILIIEAQKIFLEKHLLVWIGHFTSATHSNPSAGKLYAPAAHFMLGYIKEDSDLLTYLHQQSIALFSVQ